MNRALEVHVNMSLSREGKTRKYFIYPGPLSFSIATNKLNKKNHVHSIFSVKKSMAHISWIPAQLTSITVGPSESNIVYGQLVLLIIKTG